MEENEIGRIVVDLAIQIHRDLGPGLLESVYERICGRSERIFLRIHLFSHFFLCGLCDLCENIFLRP